MLVPGLRRPQTHFERTVNKLSTFPAYRRWKKRNDGFRINFYYLYLKFILHLSSQVGKQTQNGYIIHTIWSQKLF